jgi:hypothetical protein
LAAVQTVRTLFRFPGADLASESEDSPRRSDFDGSPAVWYTDAFGGQTAPSPLLDRQRPSKMDNEIGVSAGGRSSVGTATIGLRGCNPDLAGGRYTWRSWQRMSRMPPGVIRIRVNTWVIRTAR